jgi:hypothetical protein
MKKNDDRSNSRANGGMKSQGSRPDDRETRQGQGSNGNAATPRKSNGRFSGNKRGH